MHTEELTSTHRGAMGEYAVFAGESPVRFNLWDDK